MMSFNSTFDNVFVESLANRNEVIAPKSTTDKNIVCEKCPFLLQGIQRNFRAHFNYMAVQCEPHGLADLQK